LSHFWPGGHIAPAQLSTHAPPAQCVPGRQFTLAQSFATQCMFEQVVPGAHPWQPQLEQTPTASLSGPPG
jgi:hypothetical protein